MGWCRKLMYLAPVVLACYMFTRDGFNPKSIRGKNVLVTGASSGIGEKVAYRYAELGAKLLITARRKELLDKVAKKCRRLGAKVVYAVVADMAVPADRKRLVDELETRLNGLDFLILNHATLAYSWWNGTAEDMALLEHMVNVNFLSYVDITSRVLKMLEESQGHVAVVSSMAGKYGSPCTAPYSSNKHALQGFYSSLRQELKLRKTGVSVTLVVFGPVDSDIVVEFFESRKPLPLDFKTVAGTTQMAADVLVRGTSARRYELYYPTISTVFTFLHRMFPYYMENFSGNSVLEPK